MRIQKFIFDDSQKQVQAAAVNSPKRPQRNKNEEKKVP